MGKVYAAPKDIPAPSFNAADYNAACDTYIQQVVEFAKKQGKGKLAGECIRFAVADNYANYVVFSTSPVELIHLSIGDGYQYQYANRLTATDIKNEVSRARSFAKLFAKAVEVCK